MKSLTTLMLAAILVQACSKAPRPDFSFTPEINPEAGDTIQFINQTRSGDAFHWQFGDGEDSYDTDPWHVYRQAGIYKVEINASNETGSQMTSQTIMINESTILTFLVNDSSGSILLPGAEVRVYDHPADRDNLLVTPYTGITGVEASVSFYNMEPVIYHVWVSLPEQDGYWVFRGQTQPLDQNKLNYYSVSCAWSVDQSWPTL